MGSLLFEVTSDSGGQQYFFIYRLLREAGSNLFTTHTRTAVPLAKSGYLYVYVSNETPNIDVFFDNLQVTHIRGALLEETHYYPFGLTMAGISSKAAGALENKKKYNGIEFDSDLDLNTYEAFYRDLDPQTGRWWEIDPKIEGQESESSYAAMANDPLLKSDPLGDVAEGGPGDPPSLATRIWGGVKAVGGLVEMGVGAVGGVATSWTGIGAVVGGLAVGHGADNVAAGFSQMFSGTETKTFTEQGISKGLQATGVSEQKSNTIAGYADAGISIGLTAGSGSAANSSKITSGAGSITKSSGQLGREGMTAAGIEQNATKIPSATGKAAYRIPDGLTKTTLSEVKNVAKQSYTSQIKDYVHYSQQNGLRFDLYVRPTTQLSKPLMNQVNNGNIFLNFSLPH